MRLGIAIDFPGNRFGCMSRIACLFNSVYCSGNSSIVECLGRCAKGMGNAIGDHRNSIFDHIADSTVERSNRPTQFYCLWDHVERLAVGMNGGDCHNGLF